ncbi:hypothetical protein [Thermotoga sp. KOL6]|uniref:hypothetical protein n=1 Tax=Thermotoga sp. KOL6 TaxID=126741 RepID=UPI000C763DDE|nr:hypothetical protein [Thermotoga sp. KOL6]PLV59830.1 hypothetical protein AS005_00570 [Thermotoga sp. KOL6]
MFENLFWRMARKKLVPKRKISRTHRERNGVKRVVCVSFPLNQTFRSADEFIDSLMEIIKEDLFFIDLLIFPRLTGNLLMGVFPFKTGKFEKLEPFYTDLLRYISRNLNVPVISPGVETFKMLSDVLVVRNGEIVKRYIPQSKRVIVDLGNWFVSILGKEDIFSSKVLRPMVEKEVFTFIHFDLETEEKDWWEEKKGLWARSQSLEVFGVKLSPRGTFFNNSYHGKSYISAPIPLTPNLTGFLRQNGGVKISADLEINLLKERRHKIDAVRYFLFRR